MTNKFWRCSCGGNWFSHYYGCPKLRGDNVSRVAFDGFGMLDRIEKLEAELRAKDTVIDEQQMLIDEYRKLFALIEDKFGPVRSD